MTNEVQTASRATDLEQLEKLFGPAPVLSTESVEAYEAIMTRCFESVNPRDFIEKLLTRDVVDASWEINRYMRHKNLAIERKFRVRIEYEERRAKEEAQKPHAYRHPLNEKQPEKDFDRLNELECVFHESVDDVDKIVLRKPADLDHARALEDGIKFYEKLDRLLNATVARRNNALEQLERYRTGLGQHLRHVSEEIIDAEFSTAESDAGQETLVPSDE